MTSLLPPNLLKLFQPRPHPQYLKPLTPDPARRGPDKLTGVAALLAQVKAEAEEDELKQGMADKPTEAESSGDVKDEKPDVPGKSTEGKPTLAGEYARELRKEKRKKRQERYKKELEKKCTCTDTASLTIRRQASGRPACYR